MTWKKHFKVPSNSSGTRSPLSGSLNAGYYNYGSMLPEVYTGHQNRSDRYYQYDNMDMDSEINACLDIISEFSTQNNEENGTAFEIVYNNNPTDNEVNIVKKQLQQWYKMNDFSGRIFKLFRNTIKYGDQVFIRDPETYKLFWVDMRNVVRVLVNESEGKQPEQYVIKDVNPNFENLTVAPIPASNVGTVPSGTGYSAPYNAAPSGTTNHTATGRFFNNVQESVINAEHVVHFSLTEGLDTTWPFGNSILETVFKVFKQKELLEDAILIYRIQRAPARRVFKIDTGNMPAHMAMGYVERVKNEIHQRRIPTSNGNGSQVLDATYNPMSMMEDFFFAQGADGRGSSVEVLNEGANLGEIDDLKFFNNKLARGLRVPSSYLPTGKDDSDKTYSDGGTSALIQEYRFNKYCERLQNSIISVLDREFKLFLKWRGFNIDAGLFNLAFAPPMNFAAMREVELDGDRISNFGQVSDLPYISKRFALSRFMGLSESEIVENERMWREENPTDETSQYQAKGSDLRSVGIGPGDIDADLDMADDFDSMMEPEQETPPPE